MEIVSAWKTDDLQIEADAIRFWQSEVRLPSDVDPTVRAKELVTVAYYGTELTGLMTAEISKLNDHGYCFAFFRVAVSAHWRQMLISNRLKKEGLDVLEDWAFHHPEANLSGLMTTYEAPEYRVRKSKGVSNNIDLTLIDYNDIGDEVRVLWFKHFRV